jgi:hypothetical protein
VDDGSTDATAEAAGAAGARVISARHGGPGSARSTGVEAAAAVPSGKVGILLFTDADCAAEPHFVERMVAPLVAGTAAATKGAYITDQRGLVPRFIQLEFEERYARLAGQARVDFADGHAAAYLRDVFAAAGGFDPTLRLSQNVDLAYRLSEMGKPIVFVPQALTKHRHPEGVWGYARAKAQRSYWRARSLRNHPAKIVRDAYTPLTLKVQMAALATVVSAIVVFEAVLALESRPGGAGADAAPASLSGLETGAILALVVGEVAPVVFLVAAVPFLVLAWRRDRPVLFIALPMLVVRAAALVAGTVAGAVTALFPGSNGTNSASSGSAILRDASSEPPHEKTAE